MAFRRLAKDAYEAARTRYREHEENKQHQNTDGSGSQQFPGQQYHAQNSPTQHYTPPQQQSSYVQGQSYAPQHAPLLPSRPGVSQPNYQASDGRQTTSGQAAGIVNSSYAPAYSMPQKPLISVAQSQPSIPFAESGQDIFVPLTTTTLPLPSCDSHPVSRRCINAPGNSTPPSQTNAFYGNWLLGEQGCSIWTHPYSLSWAKGQGNARSWGIAISHIDREQLAFGEPTSTGASRYYINPVGIQSIILSARELGAGSNLGLDSLQAFSAKANLAQSTNAAPVLTFPLLQGMGFVTAICQGCTPLVQSAVFFRSLQPAGVLNGGLTSKYRIILEDGKTWLLYASVPPGNASSVPFTQLDNTAVEGPAGFHGTLQVAKLPSNCSEEAYDRSAGAYAESCSISATAEGSQSTYYFQWRKAGIPNPLIMYALQHHVNSFTRTTAPHVTAMRLQTTTKGMAVGVLADEWQITERIPNDMGLTPWIPDRNISPQLGPAGAAAVVEAARAEVEQDVIGQCNLDSMYFSGKGLGKFAMMAIALHDMAGERQMALKVLQKLKDAFAIFVNNQQRTPLIYERSWRGVVSRAGMENAGADFGNGYYNDHHFHYGYFVYAAAVIGHLDPEWLRQGQNTAWVNTLVRDFANPVNDADFPFFRSFDWYHGHSWAKGLFESGDGKDEESTSEDSFASYALKMWGRVSRDANLEARGNLMLAIQAKGFQTYFLMESNNIAQPHQVIANKVTGITFENKIDHATYFGMNIEYIQGIHMIPLAPPSTLVRTANFVSEEWETYFSNGRADQVAGGWRGILYANLAIIDPRKAYEFFARQDFDWGWLDGGASRTWLLAWCAALDGL